MPSNHYLAKAVFPLPGKPRNIVRDFFSSAMQDTQKNRIKLKIDINAAAENA